MSYKLEVLASDKPLDNLQTVIRQTEQLGFTLVSLAAGTISSQPGNIATFSRSEAAGQVFLEPISGVGNSDAQEQQVNMKNGAARPLVCYGGVIVNGQLANVAAYRG